MNKQRKVLITITYNELGCIVDTKAEPYEEPNLQPTCNQLAIDCISRQAAIDLWERYHPTIAVNAMAYDKALRELPSAKSEIIYCKDCVHHIDGFFCRQANHHTSDKDHCASVFRAERREE